MIIASACLWAFSILSFGLFLSIFVYLRLIFADLKIFREILTGSPPSPTEVFRCHLTNSQS